MLSTVGLHEEQKKTGNRRVLFDAVKDGQNVAPMYVPDESEQEENESRRYAPIHY